MFVNGYRKYAVLQPSSIIACLVSAVFDSARMQWATHVEYMTQEIFKDYLHQRLRMEDRESILQLFIPPSGPYNAVFRAIWSPYSVKLEHRVNLQEVDSRQCPPEQRGATFDGPEHFSEMRAIPGQDLREDIADRTEAIIQRVQALLPATHKLQTGVIYFKMGETASLNSQGMDLRIQALNYQP